MADNTLNSRQQSAFDLLADTLRQWGLETLLPDLRKFIVQGDTNPATLSLELSQTDAYKERFKANELRLKAGLPELKPAEYIALEEQYNNVLRAYGLPQGFYDSKDDFTKFIANDLSPDELKARAQVAHDQYEAAPDEMKQLWNKYFGSKGDAIAAILDPKTATAVIQDRAQQVELGYAAAQNGFNISQGRAQQFQQAGVTLEGARAAYQKISQISQTDQSIAKRFGTQFGQQAEENDLILGDGDAANKRRTLYNDEESLFRGGSAFGDQAALGVSQNQ